MVRILLSLALLFLYSTTSYANTTNIDKLQIKNIYYSKKDKKWYVSLHDVLSSNELSFEQLFIDDELSTTIPAGTKSPDHRRVFIPSKSYNPTLCHVAYMVLYDNENEVIQKTDRFYFGDKTKCSDKKSKTSHKDTLYYISPTGDDSNDGKSLNHPFKTISHALNTAKGGDTILLKGGTYREANILYNKPNITGKYITLQNYNGEKVTIKGSKIIKNWERYKGNIWKLSSSDDSGLDRTVHFQQVFYGNGKQLLKVGYPNYLKENGQFIWKAPYKRYMPIKENPNNPFGMSEGTFYVKKLSNGTFDLYVWLPNGKTPLDSNVTMEVSDARFILYAYDVSHLKLKGLTFMHSSSAGFGNAQNGFQGGVGVTVGKYAIIENCEIAYMDFAGLSLSLGSRGKKSQNMYQKVTHSKIHDNGATGISSTTGGFFIFENEFYQNSSRPFIQYWHTGAIKTSAGGWGEISDNYIHDEFAHGIWFDSCHNNNANNSIVVARNYLDKLGYRTDNPLDIANLRGHAIFFEQSSHILIDHNIVNNTFQRGIYISLSQDVNVTNNLVRQSHLEQLGVRYRDDLGLKLSNVRITDNIFIDKEPNRYLDIKVFYETDNDAWFNPNNVFRNNIIYNSNGKYGGDFSTSHWSFNNNLKGVDPMIITHGSSKLNEWTIDSTSPAIQASINTLNLKFDFRRALRDTSMAMNIGPFEVITPTQYNQYVSTHLKLNPYP